MTTVVCESRSDASTGQAEIDVPATLAARARLLARGHGRKTDAIDAASVARVAQSQPGLRRVGAEDHSPVLRLLSDRRDELTQGRRTVVNRLHRLLRDLHLRRRSDRAVGGGCRETPGPDPTSVGRRSRAQGDGSSAPRRPTPARPGPRSEPHPLRRCCTSQRHYPHRRLLGSATCWRPKSRGHVGDISRFGSSDHFAGTPVRPRSRSPAARSPAIGFRAAATARSTTRCISRLGSRPCIRALGTTITSAGSPSTSRLARRSAA